MRVGVIGGGQLAWMMAQGARSLDLKLIVQTARRDDPAVEIADDVILAAIDDAQATAELSDRCDVITFENEFVDLAALRSLEQRGVQFFPQLNVLAPLLDKYDQRRFLQEIGLPVPQFAAIDSTHPALSQFGFPAVLKARRHGYDGQGTFIVRSPADFDAVPQIEQLLLEEFVPFERELAVMVARSQQGEIVTYPVVETQQQDQVCRRVLVTDLPIEIQQAVEAIARQFVTALQAVGIFGIELFWTADDRSPLLVNEVAPRTHNSGHFSIEACHTSQFEQQLRAVCGLPLGSAAMKVPGAVMVNLLGYEASQSDYAAVRDRLAQLPQTFVHWYGKAESRPGRKLGHVTVLMDSADREQAIERAAAIEAIWYPH